MTMRHDHAPARHRPAVRLAALGAIALWGLAAAGCSQTIDQKTAENAIKQKLQAQQPDSGNVTISCPSSIQVKAGSTFKCTLQAEDGSTIGITATQTDDNGGFDFVVDSNVSSGPDGG